MEITLTLQDLGLLIIGVGLIVLIGYCISLVKNLVTTIKHTNKILEDTKIITDIAATRATDVDKIVGDVSVSVSTLANNLKGNQSTIKAISTIISAIGSMRKLLAPGNNKK